MQSGEPRSGVQSGKPRRVAAVGVLAALVADWVVAAVLVLMRRPVRQDAQAGAPDKR